METSDKLAITSLVDVSTMSSKDKGIYNKYHASLDIMKSNTIIDFGSEAQRKLETSSNELLTSVKGKDAGESGKLILSLKSGMDDYKRKSKGGLLSTIFDTPYKKIQRLKSAHESVSKNISNIKVGLQDEYVKSQRDLMIMEKLFVRNQEYFNEISIVITAGYDKLNDAYLRREELEQLMQTTDESESDDYSNNRHELMLLEKNITSLERTLTDLQLSRMAILQTAPQINILKENSQKIMENVKNVINNVIPLWTNSVTIGITLERQAETNAMLKAVRETSNDMLIKNAEKLKSASASIAEESNKPIIDLETIKKVQDLIDETINNIHEINISNKQRTLEVAQQTNEFEARTMDIKKGVYYLNIDKNENKLLD